MSIQILQKTTAIAGMIALTACGGGGAGTSSSVSGYVLDGNVSNTRVCIDTNKDKQCSASENYTTTDANGHYTLQYSNSIDIEQYELIADVRYTEASDADYTSGAPDYDYVMSAFDTTQEEVNISPVSTYMKVLKNTTGKTNAQVITEVSTTIESSETVLNQEMSTTSVSSYLTANYIQNESSTNSDEAKINQRLHNINEVIARSMQQSQGQWEDSIYNGTIPIQNTAWSEYSSLVVENSHYAVFSNFDTIVQRVGNYPQDAFYAEVIASSFAFGAPPASVLANFIDYQNNLSAAQNELSGTIIKYSTTFSGITSTNYIQFSTNVLNFYVVAADMCIQGSAPFPADASMSPDTFITTMNDSLAQQAQLITGMSYTPAVYTSSVPSNCSSLGDVIANFENTMEAPQTTTNGLPDCMGQICAIQQNIDNGVGQGVIVAEKEVLPAPSIGSETNYSSPATISTCSNKPFAELNACARPSK